MSTKQLLDLPIEVIETILCHCSYDEISQSRLVCIFFNETCQRLLNHGFSRVDKFHAYIQRAIKNKLPRRESERRNHPLAKHVNALSAIETRLSLLNMTYMKYVDLQLCSFIPGKVLDEMMNVLRALADVTTTPRTHELLQELRDISSMAMEHFEDKIVPNLRNKIPAADRCMGISLSLPSMSAPLTPCISPFNDISRQIVRLSSPTQQLSNRPTGFRNEITLLQATVQMTTNSVSGMKKQLSSWKEAETDRMRKQAELERKLKDQTRLLNEQSQKLLDQERRLRQLGQSHSHCHSQLTQLYREVAKLRAEVSLKPSASITGVLTSCQSETTLAKATHIYDGADTSLSASTLVDHKDVAALCESVGSKQMMPTVELYDTITATKNFERNASESISSNKRKIEVLEGGVSKRRLTRAAKHRKA